MPQKSIELSLKHLKEESFGKIPNKCNLDVTRLSAPHLDSFNYLLRRGLMDAAQSIPPLEFVMENEDKVELSIVSHSVKIGKPTVPLKSEEVKDLRMFPKECTETGTTYAAPLNFVLSWTLNDRVMPFIDVNFCDIPIMLMSDNCHLNGLTPKELVRQGELVNETGGYFIVNGGAKVMRLLIANRRNFPQALIRDSWKKRDADFSNKGIFIRCVAIDQTAILNVLHYLNSGDAKLAFRIGGNYFFIPLIMCLMAFCDNTFLQIYKDLLKGMEGNMYFAEKIKSMMREVISEGLFNSILCRRYIGKSFRHKLEDVVPSWYKDEQICDYLLSNYVLIHLDNKGTKYHTLCHMARKLYQLVDDKCIGESTDTLCMQEVHLPGHSLVQVIKEKFLLFLQSIKILAKFKNKDDFSKDPNYSFTEADMSKAVSRAKKPGDTLKTFIGSGTLNSKSGCGLPQTKGLSIQLDHLNRMRDLSHFRAIHRGSFFLEMRGLLPRRLTGDAWGFICPIHTPDGAPCGLLNHLAKDCIITNELPEDPTELVEKCFMLGMTPIGLPSTVPLEECYEVVIDGGMMGHIPKESAHEFTNQLRSLKTKNQIFKYTEIIFIHDRKYGGQHPGIYLATTVARFMRPVINIQERAIEYIGTLEQIYLNVAVSMEEIDKEIHTHLEPEKMSLLSNISKLIPFSDCNPIPRNMYQCQMGKQSMGTPLHNWKAQTFSKLYRLLYPQVPLVRNNHYDKINMEEFCMGFNAVVAIISYTGYDMEDAMIVNKCSMERGFAHGMMYKSEFIDLTENTKQRNIKVTTVFRRDPNNPDVYQFLDEHGLPHPGTPLKKGDPLYSTYDLQQLKYNVIAYKGEENVVIDKYTVMKSPDHRINELQRVCITMRLKRNPIIGDKFASRSGQKGILSRLYPMQDLPFSERGIVPDIIFNPHGIPSRMTAGKLIEVLAGKAAAEFGKSFDSSPFEFDDENTAVDYFGKILQAGGFNYYGEDVLYSGVDGRMLDVQIYEGIVYYQRLRHMTADKYQVRSTGPIDMYTRQPIKGRKKGGAIRFGEMERDCLISHGAVYTLKDRLFDCSDQNTENVCTKCGGLLSPDYIRNSDSETKANSLNLECLVCGPVAQIEKIEVPYAFKYLIAELAGLGINVKIDTETAREFMINNCPETIKEDYNYDSNSDNYPSNESNINISNKNSELTKKHKKSKHSNKSSLSSKTIKKERKREYKEEQLSSSENEYIENLD